MKWLKYVCFLSLSLAVVLNLEHFSEDAASDTLLFQSQVRPRPSAKRAPAHSEAKAEMDYGITDPKIVSVLQAIEKNSPHGRSWEHLEQDDFAVEVEKWVDDTLEAAGLEISDKDALRIGLHFYRNHDPYLRYLGFTLMYRTGPDKEGQVNLLWQLTEHPHFVDYIHDEASVSQERMVRYKLIYEITERYGSNIVSNLRSHLSEEEFFEIRSRFKYASEAKTEKDKFYLGLMKVDMLFESLD
jgi:hypothetical protein